MTVRIRPTIQEPFERQRIHGLARRKDNWKISIPRHYVSTATQEAHQRNALPLEQCPLCVGAAVGVAREFALCRDPRFRQPFARRSPRLAVHGNDGMNPSSRDEHGRGEADSSRRQDRAVPCRSTCGVDRRARDHARPDRGSPAPGRVRPITDRKNVVSMRPDPQEHRMTRPIRCLRTAHRPAPWRRRPRSRRCEVRGDDWSRQMRTIGTRQSGRGRGVSCGSVDKRPPCIEPPVVRTSS